MGVEGISCVVTGGSGLVGRRLVEMLVEAGAARVVSFDIAPKPLDALEHRAVVYQQVSQTNTTGHRQLHYDQLHCTPAEPCQIRRSSVEMQQTCAERKAAKHASMANESG